MSEEVLQIAEKRRDVKGKGERERYTQLNGELQRTARTHKKALLSEQCKEVKGRAEKERYTHILNAEFQRIARRDKKKSLPQRSMQRNRGK